jgi:hypothetical protein
MDRDRVARLRDDGAVWERRGPGMLEGNRRIHPPLLRPVEMAELLAAVVVREDDVAKLVRALAPRNAGAMLEELALLVGGRLPHDRISHALRWILPEIHDELAGVYRAAQA